MKKTDHQTTGNAVTVSPEFLGVKVVSQYLGVPTSTIYSLVEEERIPHYRIGRIIRFKRSEIDVWMEGNKKDCVAPEKVARKTVALAQKHKIDIDRIVRKAIEGTRGQRYTASCGKTRPSQRPQKGGL